MVSAAGSFARRTGAMVGLEVSVIPVQHQYIVTEPHPAIQARHAVGLAEMGVLRESGGSWYLRGLFQGENVRIDVLPRSWKPEVNFPLSRMSPDAVGLLPREG